MICFSIYNSREPNNSRQIGVMMTNVNSPYSSNMRVRYCGLLYYYLDGGGVPQKNWFPGSLCLWCANSDVIPNEWLLRSICVCLTHLSVLPILPLVTRCIHTWPGRYGVCVSVTQRKSMEITLLRKSVHKVIASILLFAVLDKNQKMQRKTLLTIFGSLVNLRTEPGVLLCCVPLHGHWGYMVFLLCGSNSHCCLMWIFSISSV